MGDLKRTKLALEQRAVTYARGTSAKPGSAQFRLLVPLTPSLLDEHSLRTRGSKRPQRALDDKLVLKECVLANLLKPHTVAFVIRHVLKGIYDHCLR